MHLLLSIPSGYNARELLLPLSAHLERHPRITSVSIVSPAAPFKTELFPELSPDFSWLAPGTDAASWNQLLRDHRPSVVVTPTTGLDPLDAPLLAAARQAGIPSVTFVSSWDNVYKMERHRRSGHRYEIPDYVAVWNDKNQEHIRRIFPEIDPAHVVVTGAPRFDYFTHHDRIPSRADILSQLGLPVEADLIHCATTELYPFEYIIAALASARDRGRLARPITLYASVHPGGDMARHRRYTRYGAHVRYSFGRREQAPIPEFRYVPTQQDIYRLIALFRATAVLVNHSSTVALESARVQVPIVNVKYPRAFDWWRWYRSSVMRDFREHYRYITDCGGSRIVHRASQLIDAVNSYLENPHQDQAGRQRIVTTLLSTTDGRASGRLLDLIIRAATV